MRPDTASSTFSVRQSGSRPSREPSAITGWPLTPLTMLDRSGARGCVADLATAGLLTRQAAFVVCARIDINQADAFLTRLRIRTLGAAGVGEALLMRSARDVIGAAFDVSGAAVPMGYLRALLRIREASGGGPGVDPFADPSSYRRLWEIFAGDPMSRKAEALRYCGDLSSATIKAVDLIDPALMHAEMLMRLSTPERVEKANAVLAMLRSSISTATSESLFTALRASVQGGSSLERYAQKAIEQADRLPDPPLLSADDVRPLTTAQALITFGTEMQNCSRTKIGEVVLGMSYVYRVEHRANDGARTILAVDLAPLSDGRWMVREIKAAKNRRPDRSVLRAVVRRLHALGAVSPGSPVSRPTRALSSVLGIYRWDLPDLGDLEDEEPADTEGAA